MVGTKRKVPGPWRNVPPSPGCPATIPRSLLLWLYLVGGSLSFPAPSDFQKSTLLGIYQRLTLVTSLLTQTNLELIHSFYDEKVKQKNQVHFLFCYFSQGSSADSEWYPERV